MIDVWYMTNRQTRHTQDPPLIDHLSLNMSSTIMSADLLRLSVIVLQFAFLALTDLTSNMAFVRLCLCQ